MVSKEEITSAKTADLREIVDNGENDVTYAHDHLKMLCPFHEDFATPSLAIYSDHYYCYGCEVHGDAIDFIQKLFKVSFEEAVKALNNTQ